MPPDGPIEQMTQAPGEFRVTATDKPATEAARRLLAVCDGDLIKAMIVLTAVADA